MQTDAKSNRSQTSTWFQTATIIIMIISLAVTAFLSVRAQQSKGISLWTVTSRSLLTTEVRTNLIILFNGNSVESPWVYTVRLANTGSLPIESRDIEKPLTMTFTDSRIVHAEVSAKEPHDVEANAIHSSDKLTLRHGLLNPGDWFEADVLFDGQPPQPALSYRVTGLNTPLQITEFQPAADEAFISWLPVPARYFVVTIVGLCVVAFFVLVLYGIKDIIVSLTLSTDQILSRLPGELKGRMLTNKEALAEEIWNKLPSPLDDRVEEAIISAPFDANSVSSDEMLNQVREAVSKIPIGRRVAWADVVVVFVLLLITICFAIVTISFWNFLL